MSLLTGHVGHIAFRENEEVPTGLITDSEIEIGRYLIRLTSFRDVLRDQQGHLRVRFAACVRSVGSRYALSTCREL